MDYEKIKELKEQLHTTILEHWWEQEFLTGPWWLLLCTSVVFIAVWWKLVDKSRLVEITSYGLFIALTAEILDSIGNGLVLWSYPIKLLPINPPILPMNVIYLPIMYMLILQYFPKWKAFIIANIAAALFYSWVGEPLFIWLGLYQVYEWNVNYSIPIYVAIAILFRWITEKVVIVQKKQQ